APAARTGQRAPARAPISAGWPGTALGSHDGGLGRTGLPRAWGAVPTAGVRWLRGAAPRRSRAPRLAPPVRASRPVRPPARGRRTLPEPSTSTRRREDSTLRFPRRRTLRTGRRSLGSAARDGGRFDRNRAPPGTPAPPG